MPKKYNIKITKRAINDINDIWEYIALDSHTKATHFINQLEQTIKTLDFFPERCPIIPENIYFQKQYRHLIIEAYRIIFRIEKNIIYIIRIIHGSKLANL